MAVNSNLNLIRSLPLEDPIRLARVRADIPKPLMRTSSQEAEIRMGDENPNPRLRVSALGEPSGNPQVAEVWGDLRIDWEPKILCEQMASRTSVGKNGEPDKKRTMEEVLCGQICGANEGKNGESYKKRRTQSVVDMDEEIWGNLPDEMADIVASHLPFTALIRARAVCRNWKSMIFSPIFRPSYESDTPWLMLQCKDEGPGRWFFDLGLNRWHRIEAKPFQRSVCVAASGGILCLYKEGPRVAKLSLFNPISGDRTKLPVLHGRVKMAILAMDPDSEVYRLLVVVLGRNGLMLRMHQPNSSRWTKSVMHTSSKLLKGVTDAVLCEDRLYCITHKNWGILKVYDVRESVWKDLAVKRPRIFRVNLKKTPRLYLVESQGDLLMVLRIVGPWWDGPEDEESCTEGLQEPVTRSALARKRVWIFKLDLGQMMWTELNDIQGRILFLSRLGSKSVRATGRGNLIYFVESERAKHVVSYDVGTESWEEFTYFPYIDLPQTLYSHYPTEGLWFEPRMR